MKPVATATAATTGPVELPSVPRPPAGWAGLDLLGVALVLFVALALARRLRGRSAPAVELVTVGIFMVAALVRLSVVRPELGYAAAVAAAVVAAVLVATVGVEVFWGLVVRFDPAFGVGAQVVVDDVEGRIRRLRARWVEIETSDGWVVRTPFRRLYRGVRVRSAGHRTAVPVRFELPVSGDAAAARARAWDLVLSSPWANLTPPPEIEVDDGGETLRVEAYTFGREGRSRLVADVRSAWGS